MVSATARKRINENDIITMVAEDNPKREGSAAHRRFEYYRDGMTVREAKAAGLLAVDIAHDVGKDFISLRPGITTNGEDQPRKAKKAAKAKAKPAKKAKKAKAKKQVEAETVTEDEATA